MTDSSSRSAPSRCNCDCTFFSRNPLVHLPFAVAVADAAVAAANAAKSSFDGTHGATRVATPSSSSPSISSSSSSAGSSPSLATPSLLGLESVRSFSTTTPSAAQQSTSTEKKEADDDSIDLAHLNSLLYQLAQPSQSSRPTVVGSSSPRTSASTTPRLRGNGTLREPAHQRRERKAKFESLLDTFHQATFCTFEPGFTSSYQLSASDLVSAFDSQGNPVTPIAPNDILRGVASSMSEPAYQHKAESGSVPSAEDPGKLIQASGIAAPYQDAIKEAIQARIDQGKSRPKLVGILATPSPPSVAYAEWTRKACEAVGIQFEIWKTWDEASVQEGGDEPARNGSSPDFDLEADVEDLIIAANADDEVHGIMVYYPIFHGRQDTYLQQIVDPRKDVEGLHFSYCWNMYHNVRWVAPSQLGGAPGTTSELPAKEAAAVAAQANGHEEQVPAGMAKSILPCTPLAMVKCLEAIGAYDRNLPYGDRLYGKTVTVVNRSEVVGRPLAALLANDGAKVYSVDIDSIQEFNKRAETTDAASSPTDAPTQQGSRARSKAVLEAHARNAASRLRPHHVVRASPLTAEQCIRNSHVVIAGVPSASYKIPTEWIRPGATCINFSSEKNFDKDVRQRAGMYLPAIGKTTIAMLQRNLLRLVEYRELARR